MEQAREFAILQGRSGKASLQRCLLSYEWGRGPKDSHRKDTPGTANTRPQGAGGMPVVFGEQQGGQLNGSSERGGERAGGHVDRALGGHYQGSDTDSG